MPDPADKPKKRAVLRPADRFPPLVSAEPAQQGLFLGSRPGLPVVRPDDLLALRIELVNLTVQAGPPATVSKTAPGDSFIVLHFPPQSIAEEVFFERAPAGMNQPQTPPLPPGITPPPLPVSNEAVAPPPIRARVAGESRLAFAVPDGFSAPYKLSALLKACETLRLSVGPNALPRQRPPMVLPGQILAQELVALSALSDSVRRRLGLAALRNRQLALTEGGGSSVLRARASIGPLGQIGLSSLPGRLTDRLPPLRIKPRPGLPSARQTAIEMPWRLILSPHAGERFHHAGEPVTSPLTARTELWHSRLVAPDASGRIIAPPNADPRRTVRAVWALTGEGSDKAMSPVFPQAADLPSTAGAPRPFLTPLNDFDRFQITHLSSNFSVSNYQPEPVETSHLMLSALGGWLEARGEWDPPGLSVEEWTHRASMGRDHCVRVVYKGFLFPFGHRVALIKVSERKFHNGKANTPALAGNPAYLRQRMFVVVREREREFIDPELLRADGGSFQRQFPFNKVRILTTVTPELDEPASPAARVDAFGQSLFWPCVNGQPFHFRCVGTDIDGRRSEFELPLLFMDNTMASPRKRQGSRLVPDFPAAEAAAEAAQVEWLARGNRRTADLRGQRLAMAPSSQPGDTAVEALSLSFGAEVKARSNGLRTYARGLSQPVFYPSVTAATARIAAISQLSGNAAANELTWNGHYLRQGFTGNVGEVFADVAGAGQLDFSSQGDRSGGFVMPNMAPRALSRSTGPVSVDPARFVAGTDIGGADLFPGGLAGLPLPLLFGCIPLGEVIEAVAHIGDSPGKVPSFVSEASTKVESFISSLVRALSFVRDLGGQGTSLAKAAIDVIQGIFRDLLAQAQAMAAAEVAPVVQAIEQLQTALDDLRTQFAAIVSDAPGTDLPGIDSLPDLASLPALIDTLLPQVQQVAAAVNGAPLPSGFKQGVLGVVNQATNALTDFKTLAALIPQGKALYAALDAIVGHPESLGDLFEHPDQLADRLEDVEAAIVAIRATLAGFRLLEGAPRKAILDVLQTVTDVLDAAGDLLHLLEGLLGEELVIRFDWSPEIRSWGFVPGKPLFRANDPHGFFVAVEARVKKTGGGAPRIGVVCGLKHFDLVLINPAAFIELNFEKIEFSVDSSSKMNVDVLLNDIKFVGPLSFVETLKDLIPLDGFSDPPYLDISTKGIDAGFSMALPSIAVGMFSISNLSLGAGFTVPFIGQPLSVRFNFCTREQPFNLTVSLFGGGGFFGITLDPHGVQILEASFEFGASISIDFGVASGGVHVMAGIYFRMENDAASLTGYFRLGGHVSVLGMISASLELYLSLRYEFETGKAVGRAQLTIEVEVFMFSVSVTVECERKFAGSNGDPTFRDLLGLDPSLSLAQELAQIDTTESQATDYAWRDYCDAFA